MLSRTDISHVLAPLAVLDVSGVSQSVCAYPWAWPSAYHRHPRPHCSTQALSCRQCSPAAKQQCIVSADLCNEHGNTPQMTSRRCFHLQQNLTCCGQGTLMCSLIILAGGSDRRDPESQCKSNWNWIVLPKPVISNKILFERLSGDSSYGMPMLCWIPVEEASKDIKCAMVGQCHWVQLVTASSRSAAVLLGSSLSWARNNKQTTEDCGLT